MSINPTVREKIEATIANLVAGQQGGLQYMILEPPAPGVPHYDCTSFQAEAKDNYCEDTFPPVDRSRCDKFRELAPEVIQLVVDYCDVFTVARLRATSRSLRSRFDPTKDHHLPTAQMLEEKLDDIRSTAYIGLLVLKGRTAKSRRYAIVTRTPPEDNALLRAFFLATSSEVIRDIKQIAAEKDPSTRVVQLSIDRLENGKAVVDRAFRTVFADHPLDGFWEWCHEAHRLGSPLLQLM
eukprot:Sspe_Gene.32010::Locus_15722_Transcript_1_1_Confidence_1.000_Length_905::g.32010::m.32010